MLYEFEFQSFNERDKVQAWAYVPAAEPKGIIQLVHGLGEHSRRYLHMIVAFLDAGYIVVADDHVGHGKTAIVNNTWGDWGTKGFETMMEDERKLQQWALEKFEGLPYFMFGHSMGSVIVRQFIAKYGDTLSGATICGTMGSDFPIHKVDKQYKALLDDNKGDEVDEALLGEFFGWMVKRCKEVKLGNEWICADPYVQVDHAHDPFNAFTKPVNNRSMYYFIQMIDSITGIEWAEKVPKDLPIYNIAGDQDPIGNYGKGVYETTNWLVDTDHKVETKVYPGCRHEVHNYNSIKDEVEEGIIQFFNDTKN